MFVCMVGGVDHGRRVLTLGVQCRSLSLPISGCAINVVVRHSVARRQNESG